MRVDVNEVNWDNDARVVHGGVLFTGEVVERAPGGAVVAVTTYLNGREDGPSTEWYPSGRLKARGLARCGLAVGVHQVWHPNGQLATEAELDDHGDYLSLRKWDRNGNTIMDSTYHHS